MKKDKSKNSKVKWYNMKMNYYSGKLLAFEVVINFAYVTSFILTPFVIAFNEGPMKYLRWFEFCIDAMILLSIVIGIFKPRKVEDDILDNLKEILYRHILTFSFFVYFILDLASVLPTIITLGLNATAYFTKIIRYIHFKRLTHTMNFLGEFLRIYFPYNQESFNNFLKLTKTLLYLGMIFHLLACVWILIG